MTYRYGETKKVFDQTKSSALWPTTFLIGIWLLCLSPATYANPGLDWLTAQADSGSITTAADVATAYQSTAEALNTFHVLSETPPPETQNALQFINTESYRNTENIARQIIANLDAGNDVSVLVNELIASQNDNGGFGELSGYNSTVLDTAFALTALMKAGINSANVMGAAIAFLLTENQHPDGGFALDGANESSVYVSALTSYALQQFLFTYNVSANVDAVNNYLFQSQLANEGWETDWETALALLAVVPVTTDTSRYATAVDILKAHQNENAAWGNDVYATALALRALHNVENLPFPVDPTHATFTGRVVDDNTGLPLTSVIVALEQVPEMQIATDIDGSFTLLNIIPNPYTVNYQLDGYNTAFQSVTAQTGQMLNLGTIRLGPLPDVGIIAGTVTDANTGQPIANALVEITGDTTRSATTDNVGYYRIVESPGQITVTISATDYDSISVVGTIVAGVTLSFSPALNLVGTTPSDPEVTVQGRVVDGDTDNPLYNALVTVVGTPHTIHSDSQGRFSLSDIDAGGLTIDVSLENYRTVRFETLASPSSTVDLGTVRLSPAIAASTTTIIGIVSEMGTGSPIAGATVSVTGLDNSRVVTSAEGSYRIENITTLELTLAATATGYLGSHQDITLLEHGTVTVNIPLETVVVNDLAISDLSTAQSSYPAYSKVPITAQFSNGGSEPKALQLMVKVVNELGQTISYQAIAHADLPDDIADSMLTVPAGEHILTELDWNTNRFPPGTYEVIIQAHDLAVTSRSLAERSVRLNIEPTQVVNVLVEPEPRFSYFGATESITFQAKLENRSNMNTEALITSTWADPEGTVLREDTITVALTPEETRKNVTLAEFSHDFAQSGQYPLAIQVNGTQAGSANGLSISVAPGVRITPSEDIAPTTVVPDGDKRIRINIQLTGVEEG